MSTISIMRFALEFCKDPNRNFQKINYFCETRMFLHLIDRRDTLSICDLVFCNATAFEGSLLTSIYLQSEGMRPGSVIVLTTQRHTSKLFELFQFSIISTLRQGPFRISVDRVCDEHRARELPFIIHLAHNPPSQLCSLNDPKEVLLPHDKPDRG